MDVADHEAIAELVPLLGKARPWKLRRERGWIWRAAVAAGVSAFSLAQAWWVVSWTANIPTSDLGFFRSLDPKAAVWPGFPIVLPLLAFSLAVVFRGMTWLRRLWSMRDPVSAALQRALDADEVHEFQIEAVSVLIPAATGEHRDDPWYLFDLGDASALLLHGPEFVRTAEFPNTAFSYVRAPRAGAVVWMSVHGDRLVPSASGRYDVRPEYLDSHDLVLEGSFDEVCSRVLQRRPDGETSSSG